MSETDFLSEVMNFNLSDLSAFNETPQTTADPNIYKTNPVKMSKSEDGHYHAKIRLLYNPFSVKESIVKSVKYSMFDKDGFFQADSELALNSRNCPIFKAWKKLHFSGDVAKDEWAKKMFDKSETKWVLVQIIEDENQPELVGQFKIMKLPAVIFEKMQARSTQANGKKVAWMDYLFGPILEMDVAPGPEDKANPERKQREISYLLCDFDSEPYPIINTDGSQLFTDDEMETIETYNSTKNALLKAKTEKAKAEKQQVLDNLVDDIKALYKKAITFMKANALDVVELKGYHAWDNELKERVQNWLNLVLDMKNPQGDDTPSTSATPSASTEETTPTEQSDDVFGSVMEDEDNLEDFEF